jgi:site-specific recombinase XerD
LADTSTAEESIIQKLTNASLPDDRRRPKPTIKQKLAALRMLYDFLVIRQLVPVNPTTSVRGPKYVVKRGKTPVWSREDTKKLLESIPRDDLAGLRDRALISTMLFRQAIGSQVGEHIFLLGHRFGHGHRRHR